MDIGFDPKCITQESPNAPYQQEWWIYSIDYDYIKSIGGVAKCFHPKPRAGGTDLGAYELSGEPHSFSEPGGCVPDENRDPGTAVGITAATATTTTTTTSTSTSTSASTSTSTATPSTSTATTTTTGMGGASTTASVATSAVASTGAPGAGGADSGAAAVDDGASSEAGCGCRIFVGGSGRASGAGGSLVLLLAGLWSYRRRGH